MRKNNLDSTGLSLSQAQSISNLCNQKAKQIDNTISKINNFSQTMVIDGESHQISQPFSIPTNIQTLILEKANLHATQAFLMENIKAKDNELLSLKDSVADTDDIVLPDEPNYKPHVAIENVNEEWGWEQLSNKELNEYIKANTYAAHVGQFIHNKSALANLRKELPQIPLIEWFEVEDGKKSLVNNVIHHTDEQLYTIHEDLAKLHREFEQRVNYFKSKVKNLVTIKNSEIAKENSDALNVITTDNELLRSKYHDEYDKVIDKIKNIKSKFEETRQKNIKIVAAKRIRIDPIFQELIDDFLDSNDD